MPQKASSYLLDQSYLASVAFLPSDQDSAIDVSTAAANVHYRTGGGWTGTRTITVEGTPADGSTVVISNNSGQTIELANGTGTPLDVGTLPLVIRDGEWVGLVTHAATSKLIDATGGVGLDIRGDLSRQNTVTVAQIADPGNLNAAQLGSASATDGHVLKADGSGGTVWEAESGGGGGIATEQAVAAALPYHTWNGSTFTSAATPSPEPSANLTPGRDELTVALGAPTITQTTLFNWPTQQYVTDGTSDRILYFGEGDLPDFVSGQALYFVGIFHLVSGTANPDIDLRKGGFSDVVYYNTSNGSATMSSTDDVIDTRFVDPSNDGHTRIEAAGPADTWFFYLKLDPITNSTQDFEVRFRTDGACTCQGGLIYVGYDNLVPGTDALPLPDFPSQAELTGTGPWSITVTNAGATLVPPALPVSPDARVVYEATVEITGSGTLALDASTAAWAYDAPSGDVLSAGTYDLGLLGREADTLWRVDWSARQ